MNQDQPAITEPRDLAAPGRILRSVVSLTDRINPFLAASQPRELEMDAADRAGQVAAYLADRDAKIEIVNADRLLRWAARYRPHVCEVPLQLRAWDPKFPAPDRLFIPINIRFGPRRCAP